MSLFYFPNDQVFDFFPPLIKYPPYCHSLIANIFIKKKKKNDKHIPRTNFFNLFFFSAKPKHKAPKKTFQQACAETNKKPGQCGLRFCNLLLKTVTGFHTDFKNNNKELTITCTQTHCKKTSCKQIYKYYSILVSVLI